MAKRNLVTAMKGRTYMMSRLLQLMWSLLTVVLVNVRLNVAFPRTAIGKNMMDLLMLVTLQLRGNQNGSANKNVLIGLIATDLTSKMETVGFLKFHQRVFQILACSTVLRAGSVLSQVRIATLNLLTKSEMSLSGMMMMTSKKRTSMSCLETGKFVQAKQA